MGLAKADSLSKIIAFIAVAFGVLALILVCVGVSTPKWESTYTDTGNGTYALSGTANFFYTCSFTNGTFNNCSSRTVNLTGYPGYSSSYPWAIDYNLRMQNAAGLCIVGILFLAFGIIATLIMALIPLSIWTNFLPPSVLFIACLFMLAGMAEGSRYLLFNGYSANLYQAGHLFTMLALFLSAFASGRIHFFRMKEEEEKRAKKTVRK